ncbi:MAG: PilZ domain-containing protein [Acidobacteria bacterium]|nr:PilZ domain-containing protein [Acidobacteriota bacterium]
MTTATGAERRRHHRYDLAMPLEVKPSKKAAASIQTITRDISATGIYFDVTDGIEPGSEIRFELVLPSQLTHGESVHIRCRGKIIRVERPDEQGRMGVAATIDSYDFVKTEKKGRSRS